MSLDSILVSWVTPAAIGLVEQSILDFAGEQSGGKFSAKLQDTRLAQPTCELETVQVRGNLCKIAEHPPRSADL